VRAGRELRYDPAVRRVQGILGPNDVRQQARTADDHGGRGFITRGLDRQDAS